MTLILNIFEMIPSAFMTQFGSESREEILLLKILKMVETQFLIKGQIIYQLICTEMILWTRQQDLKLSNLKVFED